MTGLSASPRSTFVMSRAGRDEQAWLVAERQDGLAHALGANPSLVSGLVHGGLGAAAGAGLGAMCGLVWWPAHVGALALTAGGALGAAAASHGWQAGERVAEQIGLPDEPPTALEIVGSQAHDVVTASTGSMLLDTAVGAGVGFALAPTLGWILAGALLAALGGVGGIALLAGAHVVSQRV